MHQPDLQAFVTALEQTDQLARIAVAVDSHLELATIVNQVGGMGDGGPGLLFEQVRGTGMPVAVNLFGSAARIATALGTQDLSGLARRLAVDLAATRASLPEQALAAVVNAAPWQPVLIEQPLWQGGAHSGASLDILPAIKAWPADGGCYLTMAQVYTKDPENGSLNCGMYRVQLHGPQTATIRFRPGSDGGRHLAGWQKHNRAMPVAVVLGGPPVLMWAAGVALPADVSEVAFSSYLCQAPVEMSPCLSGELLVPSRAEVVIEGTIAPGAVRPEGPFGNHTGSYDTAALAPEMQVQAVNARPQAICPWTLVGPPPRENIGMARAASIILQPLVQMALPSLRQLHMPAEGIFHRVAFVTIDPGDTRPLAEVARILWSTNMLKGSRLLVVGTADHDPGDPAALFWRTLNRVDWHRDLLLEEGRLAVDARRRGGVTVQCDPTILAKVIERWDEYRIAGGH